ncbi:MAG: hypothetical protein J3K34DRAFT_455167 [Monoraphidium minutum]|nr:MAG: hypothetical protein J3K34DRAFT_455167 [Monoraphidium minutum]
MLETARQVGLRSTAFSKYVALQGLGLSARLSRRFPAIRDRLIADDKFLFKVVAEIIIDSACATVAEVRKRGEEFWAEFEFYLSDLIVGVVLDVALVSLIAPRAVLGRTPMAVKGGPLAKWLATVPSAMFEASIPGVKTYKPSARIACVFVKFLEYSLAGIACGLVGQGVANSLMHAKRHFAGPSEHDVEVPPLLMTSLVWGLFMGVSSNLRYQVVFGLERLVDMTIARKVPQVAYGTTVGIRFVNNVIGGENFIDLARWAGVQ